MMSHMIGELKKFFIAFGIFIVLFIVFAALLNSELYLNDKTVF